jgi:hypothetical protein
VAAGHVLCVRAQSGPAVETVEISFGEGEVLGEVRAFHNADPQKVNEEGLMACTASVRSTTY